MYYAPYILKYTFMRKSFLSCCRLPVCFIKFHFYIVSKTCILF